MKTKIASALAGAVLVFGMSSAQAALWNFTMAGEVNFAEVPNDYNLSGGSSVNVVGTFDDGVLTGGTGMISFASGSTFTLTVGDITFTPDETIFGEIPSLTLDSWTLDTANGGFIFFATDSATGATFNSYFDVFDGDDANLNLISGVWTDFSVTAVPEASTYAMMLVGLGLVGFVGLARRKSLQADA